MEPVRLFYIKSKKHDFNNTMHVAIQSYLHTIALNIITSKREVPSYDLLRHMKALDNEILANDKEKYLSSNRILLMFWAICSYWNFLIRDARELLSAIKRDKAHNNLKNWHLALQCDDYNLNSTRHCLNVLHILIILIHKIDDKLLEKYAIQAIKRCSFGNKKELINRIKYGTAKPSKDN